MQKQKILSIFLALLLIASVFSSFAVYAEEKDEPVKELSAEAQNAKALISALGISLEDGFDSDGYVTRASFVHTLMQIMKNSSVDITLPYTDVASGASYRGAVAGAYQLGIISEASEFNPDSYITANEAIKMTVSALGMTNHAMISGGYPHGYITVAQRYGVSEGVSVSGDEPLDEESFWFLIKNLLVTPTYEITSVENGNLTLDKGRTFLDIYFDAYVFEGVINNSAASSLYGPNVRTDRGYIEIEGELFKYKGNAPLGYFAEAYVCESGGGTDEIIFLDLSENIELTINADKVVSVENNKIRYISDNENEKSANLSDECALIFNGKSRPKYDISDITVINSHITLISNDTDGKYDVLKVYDGTTMYVDSVNIFETVLNDKNYGILDLGSDSDILYYIESDGKEIDFEDIEPGSLATVFKSDDETLFEIKVSTETVDAKLSELNTGENKIYLDGAEYRYSEYFEKYYLDTLLSGKSYSFVLSCNKTVEAVASDSAVMTYAYLIAMSNPSGLSVDIEFKLCLSNGKIETYKVSEKAMLNGTKIKSTDEITSHLKIDGKCNSQLIKVNINKDGVIDKIDTAGANLGMLTGDEQPYDSLTKFTYNNESRSNLYILRSNYMVYPHFHLGASTPMFVVDESADSESEKYSVTVPSVYFSENNLISAAGSGKDEYGNRCYELTPYDVDEFGNCSVAVFLKSKYSVSRYSEGGVVSSVTRAIAPNEEHGLKITVARSVVTTSGSASASFVDYYITNPDVLKEIDDGASFDEPCLSIGDYIRFEAVGANIIKTVSVDFKREGGIIKSAVAANGSNYGSSPIYYYETVYTRGGIMMTTVQTGSEEASPLMLRTWKLGGTVPVYDSKTDSILLMTADAIQSYKPAGGECHKIMIKTIEGSANAVCLYK